jgi:hypothetical protein
VDPVPDPLLLRKSGSAWNRTRTSGLAARNSDHWTTEAVLKVTTVNENCLSPTSKLVSLITYDSTLNKLEIYSSATSVNLQRSSWCYFPGESTLCVLSYHWGCWVSSYIHYRSVRFVAFTAVTIKIAMFWNVKNQFVPHRRHYFSAPVSSWLMLCKIWGFYCGHYEDCHLLECKKPFRTSQETLLLRYSV